MILRLYSGAPFDRKHKTIYATNLIRQNSLEALKVFETTNNVRFVNSSTIEIQFDSIAPANAYAILGANYAIVNQKDVGYCYYIQNATIINNVIQYSITPDNWQTYICNATGFLIDGTVRQTAQTLSDAAKYLPIEKAHASDGFTFNSFGWAATLTHYVVFWIADAYGIHGFQTKCANYSDAISTAAQVVMVNKYQYDSNPNQWFDCRVVKLAILPSTYCEEQTSSVNDITLKNDVSGGIVTAKGGKVFTKTVTHTITNYPKKTIYVGSIANRIKLPTDFELSHTATVKIICNELATFDVSLEVGAQKLSLTEDFSMPLVYSEDAQKLIKNDVSFAIKEVGNVVGIVTSIISENYLGAVIGGISAARDVATYITNRAPDPVNMSGSGNALMTFAGGGLGYYVYTPINWLDIEANINKFGYIYENVIRSYDITSFSGWNKTFLKLSNTSINGAIPQAARENIAMELADGVFITYVST